MKSPITTILGLLTVLSTALSSAPGLLGQIAHWTALGAGSLFAYNTQDSSGSQPPATK